MVRQNIDAPIYTLGDCPLVPDGFRLIVKLNGAHSVVSLICPTSVCPVQAQEVFTNLESHFLLTLLAFPESCARTVLLAVVRLSPHEWHLLSEALLLHLRRTSASLQDTNKVPNAGRSPWEGVCIESLLLSEAATKEEECRSLWDALTTLRRKLRPFALLIPPHALLSGYRLVALREQPVG